MLYLAVPLLLFKYFKSEWSPLKMLIGATSYATEKDSINTTFSKHPREHFTVIKRASLHKSDKVTILNFPGMLL